MKRGIDISKHQGNINFDEIKENFDFVIIRVAIGDDLSPDDSECSQCDSMAQHYIDECEARDIPYGLYIYSYATCVQEAINEAEHIREWYNKCNAKLGVWWDIEDADNYKANHGVDYHDTQSFAVAWLDELSDIPVKGIYASHSWLNDYMNVDELKEHGAIIWEAHWNDDGQICDDRFDLSQESSDYYLDDGTRIDYDIMRDELFDRLVNGNSETTTDDGRSWSREQAERVVQGLYSNLLFRGYTDGENEAIVHGLEYDMSRLEAFEAIRNSDEHQKKALIVDCYLVMRGSLPSDEEVDFWFNRTDDEIKQGILYSDEFNARYNV